ncbi:MAG TPA: hypothetical protein VFX70_03730 [Mycobacteriales bacterium]|nr:hypothetical protein [Mycobacteriales bacterium]
MADSGFRQDVRDILKADRGPYRTRFRIVAIVISVLLVLAVAGGATWYRYSCGFSDDLSRGGLTGTCYGVTNGSHIFADNLRGIEKKIHTQNRKVTHSGHYVTVAFYTPMAVGPGETELPETILHDLQGAFVAQWRVNHTTAISGDEPKIRLVLADPGSKAKHWKEVADMLRNHIGKPDNLVAVTGLGTSTKATKNFIRRMSANHVAMVGSVITSTDLNGTAFPGLIRVAPTNQDEALAAINALPHSVRTAMLVQDRNRTDNYVTTLGSAFAARIKATGRKVVGQVETYSSGLENPGGRFAQIANAVCLVRPDVVLFAGRGPKLGDFVQALGNRTCTDFPVTVISGDDASKVVFDRNGELAAALNGTRNVKPVTLEYTALAHPDTWTGVGANAGAASCPSAALGDSRGDVVENYRRFLRDYQRSGLGQPSSDALVDGEAIMSHDAVLTATRAIRSELPQGRTIPIPSAEQVTQNLAGLHLDNSVPGASGTIAIDDAGNPENKPIPFVELKGNRTVSFLQLTCPDAPTR